MGNFTNFKNGVKKIGGAWASDDVYFSQHRDHYCAEYIPNYPEHSKNDMWICSIDRTGAYLRGNYEIVRFNFFNNKFFSEYYNSLSDIRKYLYL